MRRDRMISARVPSSLLEWVREKNINISYFIFYNLAKAARMNICPMCSREFKSTRRNKEIIL